MLLGGSLFERHLFSFSIVSGTTYDLEKNYKDGITQDFDNFDNLDIPNIPNNMDTRHISAMSIISRSSDVVKLTDDFTIQKLLLRLL